MLDFARAEAQKRAAHVTHPLLCLDAIRTGVEQGGQAGLAAVRLCPCCCRVAADSAQWLASVPSFWLRPDCALVPVHTCHQVLVVHLQHATAVITALTATID